MSTSLQQIRTALDSYLFDNSGSVDLPENIVELLEDADTDAANKAEVMETMLALYAGNKISRPTLRDRLREVVLTQPIVTGSKVVLNASVSALMAEEISTGVTLATPQKVAQWVLEFVRRPS